MQSISEPWLLFNVSTKCFAILGPSDLADSSVRYNKMSTAPKDSLSVASTSAERLIELGNRHVTNGLGRLTEGILARGQGSYVEYEDGKKLLDFSTGIGVTALGVV